MQIVAFQSTLSRGERLILHIITFIKREFQSTLSRGERPVIVTAVFDFILFQSTLSRGERRETQLNQIKGITISIHALTRRAALLWKHWKEFNGISIHALTRRAAC